MLLGLSDDAHHEAAECFQQVLTIARHQRAKSCELRAAISLSRLWQQQGKYQEAHDLLAPTYGWFTEGFDTTDLQDARVLLMEPLTSHAQAVTKGQHAQQVWPSCDGLEHGA
jgi:predicted ATPase